MSNLHSNMFLLFQILRQEFLIEESKFTFQYVSIISILSSGNLMELKKFTFQYVSIISLKESAVQAFHNNLHSNMFLLFQSMLFGHLYEKGIYIPICFYYFPSNVALYNSTTILPSFVDPVIIFCFFQ